MKRVMGKFLTAILLVLTCGCLAGCQDTGEVQRYGNAGSDQGMESTGEGASGQGNADATKFSAQDNEGDGKSEIMLVDRSTNFAWGHYDRGLFADTEGKIYGFDFSRYPIYVEYDENELTFVERLEIIRENSDPVGFFDEKDVKSFRELGETLSAKDEFTKEETSYDYGQRTLYFYQPKTQELLKVKSTGDVDYTPKNKNAKKIASKYESYIWWHGSSITEEELSRGIPTVYSTGDVKMMNFTADDAKAWAGKWVLETKDRLKAFAAQSSIPVDDVLEDDEYPEDNESAYFVFVEEAGQKENLRNPRAFWIQGNCIDFLSFDGTSNAEGAYVCHMAKIRKEDLFGIDAEMIDLNGTKWKVFDGSEK